MEFQRSADVAIVGGGLAGSLAAAMLEKSDIDYVLIDPRETYPDEFRCEKFNAHQIELLQQTGVSDVIFDAITPVADVWMARFGKLVRKQNYPHYGFAYNIVVNALRERAIPEKRFVKTSVTDIVPGCEQQRVIVSDGSAIDARLVVLASGLSTDLQKRLGFSHSIISERHCLAIGFDVTPRSEAGFPFDTMTYWPEKQSDKMSYLTFFKSGDGWRANLFGYWNIRDEQIAELRQSPEKCLHDLMPGLEKLAGAFSVTGKLRVRPIDLYQWDGEDVDGVVAIGDAWSSSCPGAGTGTTKVISDTLQLCSEHIPHWLSGPGMGAQKISSFYDDEAKLAIDEYSRAEAYKLRSLTLDKGFYWTAQRWLRFLFHAGRGRLATG